MHVYERLRKLEITVFFIGCAALALFIAWPIIGSFLYRALPVEVDDTLDYLIRGLYLIECPQLHCRGTETLLHELSQRTGIPEIDMDRSVEYWTSLIIYTPLQAVIFAALHKLGVDWFSAQWIFVFFGAALIVFSIVTWLRALFGPGPAGIAAVLVGATYFVGQGFIWISASNVALGMGFLAGGLAVSKRRGAAAWVILLCWAIAFLHVAGRGIVGAVLVTYFAAIGPPWSRRDLIAAAGIVAPVLLYTALPWIFDRPRFYIPFGHEGFSGSVLSEVLLNIVETARITFRTTEIAGGFIAFAAVGLLAFLHLPPERRRPAVASSVAFTGLCLLSLLYVYPRSPGILFARYWIPVAVTLTGASSYALWHAIPLFRFNRADIRALWQQDFRNSDGFLSPHAWRLASGSAVGLLIIGMGIHIAIGAYAFERARVMVTVRQDYGFERAQPSRAVKEGCGTIWYSRHEVMHAYWLYGAINCGSFLAIARDEDMLARISDLSHAVAMNPMAMFEGRQPIRPGDAISIKSEQAPKSNCSKIDTAYPVSVRVRAQSAHAVLSIERGGADRQIEIDREPQWIEIGVLNAEISARLSASSGTITLEGVRRQTRSDAIAWPWDEGITLNFIRNVPYQSRNEIDEHFWTAQHFGILRCVDVLDDHGFSVLARVQAQLRPMP